MFRAGLFTKEGDIEAIANFIHWIQFICISCWLVPCY